jgi:hypothetical protein
MADNGDILFERLGPRVALSSGMFWLIMDTMLERPGFRFDCFRGKIERIVKRPVSCDSS